MTRTLFVALPFICLMSLTGCDDSSPPGGTPDSGKDTGLDAMSQDTAKTDLALADLALADLALADLALADQVVKDTALDIAVDGPVADAPTDAQCFGDATQPCYGGPAGTQGVGQCKAGARVCAGGAWGACVGQVGPVTET